MDKVPRIPEPRTGGQRQRDAGDGRDFLSWPSAQREAVLLINALARLVIHPPSFPPQPHIDPGAPIPPLALRNLSHPRPKSAVVPSSTSVPQRVPIQVHEPAHPPLAEPNACDNTLCRRPLRLGPYQCVAVSAFRAWRSSTCSATICFNRRFSSFSWRSVFTSLTSSPAYFVRHL